MIYEIICLIYLLGCIVMLIWNLSKQGREFTNDIPKHEVILSIPFWFIIVEAKIIMTIIAKRIN